MKRTILMMIAAFALRPANAAIISGRDCANQDLICNGSTLVCGSATEKCFNNDSLQGTFTRVRLFSLPAGTTVFVYPATPLVIYASSVSIAGTLDGIGRGMAGGSGGSTGSAGVAGTGGGPSFVGGGGGGAAAEGGAGGGYGGAGGTGSGVSGGSAGASYGSSFSSPISTDDVSMGSGGGGGGGGGASNGPGGSGGSGGAAIYIEASSVTFMGAGTILANGAGAAAVTDTGVGTHPAGGGGGSGGGVLIRATSILQPGGAGSIAANGGKGGDAAIATGGTMDPGGGGGGGRIKIFYKEASAFTINLSTSLGSVGGKLSGSFESTGTVNNGSSGTVTFGTIASSPTLAAVSAVYVTSITWAWNNGVSWGDAVAGSRAFHVYPSSAPRPIATAQATGGSGASSASETGLDPNTSYTRVIAAATDWGDSEPSLAVTTVTLASDPNAAVSTFTNVQERQLTFSWGAGSPANPAYTTYEVWRSTASDFSAVATSFENATSSTPLNLTPETVYYFKVRAMNLGGLLTSFGPSSSIATSTTPPQAPGAPIPDSSYSYDGRATFRWAAATAPSGIRDYTLEIGTFPGGADFLSTTTASASFTATGLSTGRTYYARVRARSNADVTSSFSDAGPPVSVFITTQEAAVAKPKNWPNPFDPGQGPTNIGFFMPAPGEATLSIFTLQGERVYRENRRFDAAGNQIWLWSGDSSSGRRVSPGGYIGVIETSTASGRESKRFKIAVLY